MARLVPGMGTEPTSQEAKAQEDDRLSDADVAYYTGLGTTYFVVRSAAVALVVAALAWWLSSATGWRLYAVAGVAAWVCFGLSYQAATFIEYLVMLALVMAIAGGIAWLGHGEFVWPALSAGLVGMIDGMGQRRMLWLRNVAHAQRQEAGG